MRKFFTAMFLVAISLTVWSQGPNEGTYREKEVFRNSDVVFRQIDEHTWEGNGHLMANESLYLIEGNDRAILLDAGTKIPGLKKIVEGITSKPVTLIATHVHPDHTGSAIHEFPCLYLNAADTVNIPGIMPDYTGELRFLKDGETIDLGGRTIEVVFTPGHTPGSTTFIDKEKKYGFSGDAFGSGNLLIFTDVATVMNTCHRMSRYMQENGITVLYPGHYFGMNLETPQRVKDIATLCADILSGKRKGVKPERPSLNLDLVVSDFGVRLNYNESMINPVKETQNMTKEELMRKAIELSVRNVAEGGGPFGAVIARNGDIIAVGTNRVTAEHDPTAHAEISAIRAAGQKLGTFDLSGCEIFTSCEPCPMCLGAIYWAHLDRMYYGNNKNDAAAIGFDDAFIYEELDLKPEERRLKSEVLLPEEAIKAFQDWESKTDKIAY